MTKTIKWAPKLTVAMIARVYIADAEGRHDDDLIDDVGWRLLARCQDVVLVSDSQVVCPACTTTFAVAWIDQHPDTVSTCSGCRWSVTADEYHTSWRHSDLNGVGARQAFADFVGRFPQLRTCRPKMREIDRLVTAVHTTGGVAARNLLEGRARQTLAGLDAISQSRAIGSGIMAEVQSRAIGSGIMAEVHRAKTES